MVIAVLLRWLASLVSPIGLAKFWLLAGGVFLVVTVAISAWNGQYKAGWRDALLSVAEQNSTAAAAANKVRVSVDQCFDQHGTWSVKTGSCALP
jgi:hypothetical protein